MRSAIDGASSQQHRQLARITLKDWIALSAFFERETIREGCQGEVTSSRIISDVSDEKGIDAITDGKQTRASCTMHSIQVAKLIATCLATDDSDMPNMDSTTFLKIDEICAENFVVEVHVPSEVPITDSLFYSIDELTKKIGLSQINSILDSASNVEFVPALQNKIGYQIDEMLPHDIFQKLGVLFYEIFTREESSPPNTQSDNATSEARGRYQGEELDNEKEPVSEKGRKKYAESLTCKSMKRLDLSGTMDVLQQKSLPLSICRLVTDLMECGMHEEGIFLCLRDVLSELMQIVREPDVYVHEKNIGQMTLDLNNNTLYGRSDALSSLIQATLTTPFLSQSGLSSVVLIGGDPGAGKSRLVDAITKPICERRWQFLSCKFDRLSQHQPLSTITFMFDSYFESLANMRSKLEDGIPLDEIQNQYIRTITTSVERNLSASGIVFLSKLIPSFRSLFPDIFRRVVVDDDDEKVEEETKDFNDIEVIADTDDVNSFDVGSNRDNDDYDCLISDTIKKRSLYLFQKLTQAISSPDGPVLLFFDDLQWADKESLELLTSLVVDVDPLSIEDDADQRCVCFVLAYRNNEDCKNPDLVHCINALEGSDAAQVTRIQLEGMDIEGANEMIANALKLPTRLTRSLSNVVHQKTLGNPLFVKVFLIMLCEEHSLWYSLNERRWLWTIDAIHQKSMNKGLALVLSEKLLRMPRDVQEALTFVSFFGLKVQRDVLSKASHDAQEFSRIMGFLKAAVERNILDEYNDCFAFQHDLIQQAAYERVSQEEAYSCHFNIGLQILKNLGSTDEVSVHSSVLFIALDQILAAKSVTVSEPPLRMSLAALFLRAGRYSLEVAAFPSALSYFERGLSFMGEDGWDLNFELSLRLHEAACHACYLNALPDRVPMYVDIILAHTDNFMDQVKCHHTAMQTLASKGEIKKAVSKFFEVMKELGEEFPDNVDPSLIFSTLTATKNDLSKYSTEDLLNSPKMTNKKKQWAMVFMDSINPYIFMVFPMLTPFLSERMVSLSLEYGVTKESAFAFYAYSYCLCCILQDMEEGFRWTKTTYLMLERFNATSLYPKLKLVQYSFLMFMKEPFQSARDILHNCRQELMMVGDTEYAIFSAHFYSQFAVFTGEHLSHIEKECDSLSKEMIRSKQTQSILDNASIHNMVLRLTGSGKDPFSRPEISFHDEEEILKFVELSGNIIVANSIYTYRVVTACFFQRYEYAADTIKKYHTNTEKENFRIHTVFYTFYEGLVAFHMARSQSDADMWLEIGERAIRSYRIWSTHSAWNFENKLLLLEAECFFSKGEYDSAEKKYVASIESARRHKFVHEEGLAMAMMACYFKILGDEGKEKEYLDGALGCYEKWGALGVVMHIRGD